MSKDTVQVPREWLEKIQRLTKFNTSALAATLAADANALLAAAPQVAAEAQPKPAIDPLQNPKRPTYMRLGPEDEHPAETVLRKLACWLGVGGHNAPTVDADQFHDKIIWGIQQLCKEGATMAKAEAEAQPALPTQEQIMRLAEEWGDARMDWGAGIRAKRMQEARAALQAALSALPKEKT